MADPLSIASSIVGILAAAGKVIEILGPYMSAVKDTPKIAVSVHTEVISSRIILSSLHGLLENLGVASRSRTSLVPIDDLITVFTNGVLIFSELERSVSPMNLAGINGIKLRMQWVRKEGDFVAMLDRLKGFKNTTLLLLNILQCDSDWRAVKTQDELAAKIMNLQQTTDISRRLENLEDTFDALSHIEPRRPSEARSAISALLDDRSDDQSFYSVGTQRPQPESTLQPSNLARSHPPIPSFEFQAALDESLPYRKAREGVIDFSIKGSVAASNAWSVFSGVSLSDVSILSNIAIPVYPRDISNPSHYKFMKATATKVYTARRPTEATMGMWATTISRVARPRELRFEILFEAPVIFLCPPGNNRGPVKGSPIFFINGSQASLNQTMSSLWNETVRYKGIAGKDQKQSARHADNEQASWIALLSTLQSMEHDSRAWQRLQYEQKAKPAQPPKVAAPTAPPEDIDSVLDQVNQRYTLAVAVQRKLRSWDAIPPNFKKPYAVTTWCHIVELLAVLNVYWVEFDRTNDIYRGEGNGLTVTSLKVSDLGIVFTFQVHGRNRFESNRVIPIDEVKELSFGFVPTI
ncbi:hypothetical protein SGCOL_001284 [Colletotrichum sp. CLE4]